MYPGKETVSFQVEKDVLTVTFEKLVMERLFAAEGNRMELN